jgi:4-hydroxybenzoate polyprenyltransferase
MSRSGPSPRLALAAGSSVAPGADLGSALRRGLSMLAHSGALIGLAGAGVITSASLLLGGLPPLRLLAMAFCVTTSSYAVDRIADLERDAHLSRAQGLQRMRGLIPASVGLFAAGVALGATSQHPRSAVLTFVFPLSVALYVLPWMHHLSPRLARGGMRRIKDIPLAKSFYVPLCWALLVPWAAPFFPSAGYRDALLAMSCLLPSLFITAAACDLRDEDADRAAGTLTFPVLLGRRRTISLLCAIQGASTVFIVALSLLGLVPGVAALLALGGLPTWLSLGRLTRPEADLVFFADVVFDLLWVLQPLPALAAAALAA